VLFNVPTFMICNVFHWNHRFLNEVFLNCHSSFLFSKMFSLDIKLNCNVSIHFITISDCSYICTVFCVFKGILWPFKDFRTYEYMYIYLIDWIKCWQLFSICALSASLCLGNSRIIMMACSSLLSSSLS
jgi:hypothetical protein